MPGGLTARAIAAQPAWLRSSRVEDRLPEGARVLFAGYGTSFHAALAAGQAAHALDIALGDAGHLAAIDNSVRCFVLEGEGRAAERAAAAVRALGELGCEVTLVPTRHPAVDIVPFQRLTVDLASEREVDPDMIRWDEDAWDRARRSYA